MSRGIRRKLGADGGIIIGGGFTLDCCESRKTVEPPTMFWTSGLEILIELHEITGAPKQSCFWITGSKRHSSRRH